MVMLAGPLPVGMHEPLPVRTREGHSLPETIIHEPPTISEELEEELHRLGASSDILGHLKELDMDIMDQVPGTAGQLDGSIRVSALRCLLHMLQAFGSGHSYWFKAAFLLDRIVASSTFRLEQLPLTCVVLTRIVMKLASSMPPPFASNSCPAMHMIKDFGTWLESAQNCVTDQVSDMALCMHEKTVLKALLWQIECPCVEHWSCLFFTRFGILAGRDFQAWIDQMQAKVLMFARAVVMCFPTAQLSQGRLALGLFSLSFVDAGMVPVASLKPSTKSVSEWKALLTAIQPRGELPECRLPPFMAMRVMDMISLAVNEEPDAIRASAGVVAEALGETFRKIHSFQAERP